MRCSSVWEGRLAQLGERRVRNAEVEGSNPLPSTIAWDEACQADRLTASSLGFTCEAVGV